MKLSRRLFTAFAASLLLSGSVLAANAADRIGLVVSTLNNPFFVTMKEGAESKAKELGLELVVLDSQNNPARELANSEDILGRNIKVLLINPTDSDAVASSVKAANKAKIPVITLDRSANGGDVASHIASDNVAGGKLAAETLAKELDGKGEVIELEGVAGTSAARERGKGFDDAAPELGLKIVAKQPANFDRTQGLNVAENLLQANKNANAIFAQNDEMALGAARAVQASGRDIKIIGFDGTDEGIAAVRKGVLFATIAQQPDEIGKLGVEAASKLIKGETIETHIPVPLKLITKGE
ncbi:ribose ABC transporter substrate-binding protein RbsB [Bartonella sp. HY329]|uniref:ribose ABC transporter substrate-binding protein RbsB n=1 Tax=unclassified Bartonella TaxID=2645622 RepID=UPI0021C6DABA|nr:MULTISPECIES: ribose ABC transporter substrate-binding protein RbsB [unclassified Bartonella]UXM94825.1 ribose ABC transporter substrate-binding protein RbsB [Bartonella sp. HY329]UXN09148.1 ribose ABC transporter substrate-binding protein RbsB [Bartonella sp. HY328]